MPKRLLICTDQQRLQQIILNLVSNAFKFTSKGGQIKIKAKYIQKPEDLTFQDEPIFNDLIQSAYNGALEMQVIDNGIGIKKENQSQLFRLFGYLDETKELNTKGIGLGLHICKQIVQEFGGDIICRSKWGQGTTFAFLFILSEQIIDSRQKIKRLQNPIQKTYPKIRLVRKKKQVPKKEEQIVK